MNDLDIKISGAAGQGLLRAGTILGKSLVRGGYHVFAIQDAMSRIRGGTNFFAMRVSDRPVSAMTGRVDILIALTRETLELHKDEVSQKGMIIFDGEELKAEASSENMVDLPLKKMAMETGGKPIFANTVAVGFVLGLVGYKLEILEGLFQENFTKGDLAAKNMLAAKVGYDLAREKFAAKFGHTLEAREDQKRLFLTGNDAIAFGAIAAGCRFMSAYPMSPSTSIIAYLAGKEEAAGLVTEQAEDEIAAIHLALGVSMGGARAMTATSGGGLALMTETISLLGVAEVPLVIVNCQRPGPATGLPTRTEQSDLMFCIHIGHGEFPKAVVAPGNAEQAFYGTIEAFNLADKYQIPVLLLADQYLSDSYFTVEPFDFDRVKPECSLATDEELAKISDYKRYEYSDSGVSRRAYPGQSHHLVMTDSHEHDEHGHITEDPEIRVAMVQKRQKKMLEIVKAFNGPELVGKKYAKHMVVCWGSTREPMVDAVTRLQAKGLDVAGLHFSQLWPFPRANAKAALDHDPELIVVEGNATGQLAELLRWQVGKGERVQTILKYDGRPFNVDELSGQIEKAVKS